MSHRRSERIKDLFERAFDKDTAERETFLTQECGGDQELRRSVEVLLEARKSVGDFLESPATETMRVAPQALLKPGDRLGAYTIEDLVGSGGAGAVYVAMQDDPQRRVALKVMRAGLGSERAVSRFREEANILASLRHPDIAHVYEAGVHQRLPFGPRRH